MALRNNSTVKPDSWCDCGYPQKKCAGWATSKCERVLLSKFMDELKEERAEKQRRLNAQ